MFLLYLDVIRVIIATLRTNSEEMVLVSKRATMWNALRRSAPHCVPNHDLDADCYTGPYVRQRTRRRSGLDALVYFRCLLTIMAIVPFGLLVWSTGLAPNPLIQSINSLEKQEKTEGFV